MIDAEKLNALVDNELEPAERSKIEAMLASDPTAAAQVSSLRAMKDALRDHVKPVPCEDEWKACVRRLNEIDRSTRTRSIVDRWAWAMCSCLFALILVVGFTNRGGSSVRAGAGNLMRANMGNPIHDVGNVFKWVKDSLGKAPVLPKEKLHPVMAWQGTLGNGQPVARILLKDADGPLMLTVLPPNVIVEGLAPMDDGRHFAGQTLDGNCVAWREGDLIMILGARRDADALREISQSIR